MGLVKYSPSQLETWNECPLKHHYRYVNRLRLSDEKVSQNLASGRAVHDSIAAGFKLYTPPSSVVDSAEEQAVHLIAALGMDSGSVKKYAPGVKRALGKVPDWVWNAPGWHVEEEVEADMGDFILAGRPDLWRVVVDEVQDYIQIVDIKTTDHNPLDYILWSPQVRVYALILTNLYPDYPIVYKYICVPTGASKPAQESANHTFINRTHGLTMDYVHGMIEGIEHARLVRGRARQGGATLWVL